MSAEPLVPVCELISFSALHRAFPRGTPREPVHQTVTALHQLRNRAAHHEPLINEPLRERLTDMIDLCRLLSPELALHVWAHTEIPMLLRQRP